MTQEEAIQKLNITVDLIPAGNSNRPGNRIRPTHITIHNTSNAKPGADAAMHARYVKGPDARAREVSWHFTVDDRRVVKHLPTNEKGWHAGKGNPVSIGIEICEHQGIDQRAANDRAALLTALMMLAYGIPAERVVSHQSWTGKNCPHLLLRQQGGFEAFRNRAAAFRQELQSAAPADLAGMSALDEGATEDAGTAGAEFVFELSALADLDDRSAFEAPAEAIAGDEGTGGDYVAQLERMVGRLTMENQMLRQGTQGGGASALSREEPEAD